MDDLGEGFKAARRDGQARRKANRLESPKRLVEAGIAFDSRNDGAHLIVNGKAGEHYYLWPGTGRWHLVVQRGVKLTEEQQGHGVFNLIKLIKGIDRGQRL